jgi:hypothetical protein
MTHLAKKGAIKNKHFFLRGKLPGDVDVLGEGG